MRSWIRLAMVLACVGSCTDSANEECPNGSEGCECKAGRKCDDGLACQDEVCVANGAGGGGASLCADSCEAAIVRCTLAESDRATCESDCETRQNAQPADCRDEFDAGLACQAAPGAWSCDESGHAVATGCEAQRVTHEGCVWTGDHCTELGGTATAAGACFVPCTSDADCPLGILGCPAGGTTWSVAYCAVLPEHQGQLGCGPAGWREGSVIGGCQLVCSAEGSDSECPPQMHCVADSLVDGQFFCSGV